MSIILEFPIYYNVTVKLGLPIGSMVLSVQSQLGVGHLYVLADEPVAQSETREFKTVFTRESFNDAANFNYVGSWIIPRGSQVVHLFEKKR